MVKKNFWKNKRVLITGHTGFKGSWLSLWLKSLGVHLYGISLPLSSENFFFLKLKIKNEINNYYVDIRNSKKIYAIINKIKPQIIFHMAAQPLVRNSYIDPINTYTTNIIGTANILESSKLIKNLKVFINVTSDKCYENTELNKSYKESDKLGGSDPYSSSKSCSEIITSAFKKSYYNNKNIGIATVRAGNVIGGGDNSADRLIPDILRSIKSNNTLKLRFFKSIRPWQHVLEPLSGYLILAEKLFYQPKKYSGAWNFGPNNSDNKNVLWIVNYFNSQLKKKIKYQIDKKTNVHENRLLKLDISKAKKKLNWKPIWNLKIAIKKVIEWQETYKSFGNIRKMSLKQIKDFTSSY
jgi:CDP-glucose 4,6-dehydratase